MKYIPPDFDLQKYQVTANMDFIYWVDNLIKRSKQFLCVLEKDYDFTIYKSTANDSDFVGFVNGELSEAEIFRNEVLGNISNGAFIDKNVDRFIDVLFAEEVKSSKILYEITYADLISLEKEVLTNEIKEQFEKVEDSFIPSIYEQNLGGLNNSINTSEGNEYTDFSWLKIDMSGSDSEIKSAFSSWLKKHRSSYKQKSRRTHKLKTLSNSTLRKWHDARVLAYIDLVSWNFLKKQKVSSNNIGEILFPEPMNLANRAKMIDDTTKPYAIQLTASHFIRRALKLVIEHKRNNSLNKN
jgi:hypothetical protein